MHRLMMTTLVLAASLTTPLRAFAQHSRVDGSLSWSTWTEESTTSPGWAASAAFYPSRWLGLVIDVGDYPDLPLSYTMGGVRVRAPRRRATPFAQFLVGRAPRDDFALQPGAGVDLHVHRRLAARLATDVKVSGDDGSTYLGLRFSAGLVVSVGR